MLFSILRIIMDFWFGGISKVTGFIFKPILQFLQDNNWISENYVVIAEDFINQVIDFVGFACDVFCNITGFPRELFVIAAWYLMFSFAMFTLLLAIKCIFNVWSFIRTGRTLGKELE